MQIAVVPGYTTLYLEYDARRTSERPLRAWLQAQPLTPPGAGRRLEVPVVYDGPDLETVAAETGLTAAEVRDRHSARDYHVYAVGFSPGLAFMGDLDPALQLPRRAARPPASGWRQEVLRSPRGKRPSVRSPRPEGGTCWAGA